MAAQAITVAGTLTLDDVTTPHGRRRDLPGGSALYTALAARAAAPVGVVGVVGDDAAPLLLGLLRRHGVAVDDVDVVVGPTFRWRARHDFERWVTACEHSDPGVMARWRPRLGPAAAAAPVLFVGSMPPEQQGAVLAASRAELVAVDSMVVFIEADREAVAAVAGAADLVFLNRAELAALTGAAPGEWPEAARSLCRGRTRVVVVKAGPEGAAAVTRGGIVALPALPVPLVVDPTGAGDALAGGMLGYLAAHRLPPEDCLDEALAAGLRAAARAVVDFGPAGLVAPP